MTIDPIYVAHPVPEQLSPYFERILEVNISSQESAIVPARPTGRVYFGWVPFGRAIGKANGAEFALRAGQAHLSGQLSTFDGEFTLHGPIRQFLAECTVTGAHQLTGRDMGALLNVCEIFDPDGDNPPDIAGFTSILNGFAAKATTPDLKITQAANRISEQNGDIVIGDLAAELGMSERHLRRAFTRVVGISPKPYATIKRVLFALQAFVENPDADIADVVFDAGFYDQSHMTKVFQLYLRTTPRDLRLDEDGVLRSIVAGA